MIKLKDNRKENFLLYVPKKKHKIYEEKNGKILLVFHHNKLIEKVIRALFKKPKSTDLELDELGSEVWRLIDGKNTINDIIEKMREKFGEKCEPINERLIMFIRYLNRRNWITFNKEKAKEDLKK